MELPARLTAPRLDKLSSGNTSSSTSRELVNGLRLVIGQAQSVAPQRWRAHMVADAGGTGTPLVRGRRKLRMKHGEGPEGRMKCGGAGGGVMTQLAESSQTYTIPNSG